MLTLCWPYVDLILTLSWPYVDLMLTLCWPLSIPDFFRMECVKFTKQCMDQDPKGRPETALRPTGCRLILQPWMEFLASLPTFSLRLIDFCFQMSRKGFHLQGINITLGECRKGGWVSRVLWVAKDDQRQLNVHATPTSFRRNACAPWASD